jgi:hypothetical protein
LTTIRRLNINGRNLLVHIDGKVEVPEEYRPFRSRHGKVTRKLHKRQFLKPQKTGYKRQYVGYIIRNPETGKQYNLLAHRAVAIAFIENPACYDQVDHIDGNKENNHVENLRWCNGKQNSRWARELNYRDNVDKFNGSPYSLEKPWRARLYVDGIGEVHIGYFKTRKEASESYRNMYREWFGTAPWIKANEVGAAVILKELGYK